MNQDYINGLRRAQQISRATYKGSIVADKIEVEITTITLRSEQQQKRRLLWFGSKSGRKDPRIMPKQLTFKDLFEVFSPF